MKRQSTGWEKIFANDVTWKGLVSKIYKQLMMLNSIETNSILAWKIPWTEEPNRLQSMGLQRVSWVNEHTHTHIVVLGHLRENKIWSIFISGYLLSFRSSIKFSEQALCFLFCFSQHYFIHVFPYINAVHVILSSYGTYCVQIVDSSLSLFICIIFSYMIL